jgi:hypothetical protein
VLAVGEEVGWGRRRRGGMREGTGAGDERKGMRGRKSCGWGKVEFCGERKERANRVREAQTHTHKNSIKPLRPILKNLQSQKPILPGLKIPIVLPHIRRQKHHIDRIILY